MLGAELTKLDDWKLSLLTNREVLGMLSPECRPRQLRLDEDQAVWKACDARNGRRYVALFNLSEEASLISVEAAEADLKAGDELTELWTGERRLLSSDGILQAEIPSHGCVVFGVQ